MITGLEMLLGFSLQMRPGIKEYSFFPFTDRSYFYFNGIDLVICLDYCNGIVPKCVTCHGGSISCDVPDRCKSSHISFDFPMRCFHCCKYHISLSCEKQMKFTSPWV